MKQKPIYKRTETWVAIVASIMQVFNVVLPEVITPALQELIFYTFASALAMVGTTAVTELVFNVTTKLKVAMKSQPGKPWYKKTKLWIVIGGGIIQALVLFIPDKITPEIQQMSEKILILVLSVITGHTAVDSSLIARASKNGEEEVPSADPPPEAPAT